MKRVGVFCGSSLGANPAFAEAARTLGALLARRGLGLVYGGGRVGLMGVLADAVLAGGGQVIGVIPRSLLESELPHQGLTALHVVESMDQRKLSMIREAHAFVTLPGGYGTLDEFLEVLTLAQLGYHQHPSGLLNVDGYYDSLLSQFRAAQAEGLLSAKHAAQPLVETDPAALLDALAARVLAGA